MVASDKKYPFKLGPNSGSQMLKNGIKQSELDLQQQTPRLQPRPLLYRRDDSNKSHHKNGNQKDANNQHVAELPLRLKKVDLEQIYSTK